MNRGVRAEPEQVKTFLQSEQFRAQHALDTELWRMANDTLSVARRALMPGFVDAADRYARSLSELKDACAHDTDYKNERGYWRDNGIAYKCIDRFALANRALLASPEYTMATNAARRLSA